MFYAPWCGHYKRAKPHFVTTSAKMVEQCMSGKLAAVDCTIHQQLSKRFEVKDFPSIKYGDLAFEAGDAREEASILKFMTEPKEPPTPSPPETPWSEVESDVATLRKLISNKTLKEEAHAGNALRPMVGLLCL
jgi:thiol-disulfide isomerase/thioredoxin